MKKFFTSLIVLTLIGALVFFLGWVELAVPRGSYAIVTSKTGGVHPGLLGRGSVTWMWERLLPTNASIESFAIKTVEKPFSHQGTLPSGQLYASLAGSVEAFSWELSGTLRLRIAPEQLVILAVEGSIEDQESLDTWTRALGDRMSKAVSLWLSRGSLDELWTSDGLRGGLPALAALLERDLRAEYPFLEELSVELDVARYPDIALYRSAASLYQSWIRNQQAVIEQALLETAKTGVYSAFTLSELERYGALFEKYPSLISFILAREAGTDGIKELLSRIRSD